MKHQKRLKYPKTPRNINMYVSVVFLVPGGVPEWNILGLSTEMVRNWPLWFLVLSLLVWTISFFKETHLMSLILSWTLPSFCIGLSPPLLVISMLLLKPFFFALSYVISSVNASAHSLAAWAPFCTCYGVIPISTLHDSIIQAEKEDVMCPMPSS